MKSCESLRKGIDTGSAEGRAQAGPWTWLSVKWKRFSSDRFVAGDAPLGLYF